MLAWGLVTTFLHLLGLHVADLTLGTESVSLYKADLSFGPAYLIDTPGLDISKGLDDESIIHMIFEELRRLYRSEKLLKGFVYLHDIRAPNTEGITVEVSDKGCSRRQDVKNYVLTYVSASAKDRRAVRVP